MNIIKEIAKSIIAEIEVLVINNECSLFLLLINNKGKIEYEFTNDNWHCADVDINSISIDKEDYINMSIEDIEGQIGLIV